MSRVPLIVPLIGILACSNVSSAPQAPPCTLSGSLMRLPGAAEASGAALSRRNPGVIWTHNDSSEPVIFAFDANGSLKARIAVTGARVTDWEDVAVGPCPQGSCLYVADIGDNDHARREIEIYRVAEPSLDMQATETADMLTLKYPDGPRDAEALFVAHGQVFIVSKTGAAATTIYRAPLDAKTATLTPVARLPLERVTGGAISPDGSSVALRTNEELAIFRAEDLLNGRNAEPRRFSLKPIGEQQGEGVSLGADGAIYLTGEGGGGGTLGVVRCPLD